LVTAAQPALIALLARIGSVDSSLPKASTAKAKAKAQFLGFFLFREYPLSISGLKFLIHLAFFLFGATYYCDYSKASPTLPSQFGISPYFRKAQVFP
jgi:hypothetical protein